MLTMLEAAKLMDDPIAATIVEIWPRTVPLLQVMPFFNIPGNAYSYNREDTLPGVGFRGVNESYTESTGVLNPQTEKLAISGGDLDVDTFIVATMGEDQRSVQEVLKAKALALAWYANFFKGDSATDPRVFDGVQQRFVNSQLIDAGSTDGGDALSLYKLDELIDAVKNPTHLAMNKTMRRRLTASTRDTGVSGYITHTTDAFGRQITKYNDLPILEVEEDNEGNQILDFNEVGAGGPTATATSLYCFSFEEGGLNGIQNDDMSVRDLGELDEKPALRTRVEWLAAIAVQSGKAGARLRGVKDAAVVK